jgi:hypothetical protein
MSSMAWKLVALRSAPHAVTNRKQRRAVKMMRRKTRELARE